MHAFFICAALALCATTGCHYYGEDQEVPYADGDYCADPDGEPFWDGDDASIPVPDADPPDADPPYDAGEPHTDAGDPTERPMHCAHDGECGGGICVETMCHYACTEHDECGTGHRCLDGICGYDPSAPPVCALSADCTEGSVCVDGACHSACVEDGECADPDDFCDHGLCRPDFRPITECATRAHCSEGSSCVDGSCRQPCWSDGECASGACRGGFCSE